MKWAKPLIAAVCAHIVFSKILGFLCRDFWILRVSDIEIRLFRELKRICVVLETFKKFSCLFIL